MQEELRRGSLTGSREGGKPGVIHSWRSQVSRDQITTSHVKDLELYSESNKRCPLKSYDVWNLLRIIQEHWRQWVGYKGNKIGQLLIIIEAA